MNLDRYEIIYVKKYIFILCVFKVFNMIIIIYCEYFILNIITHKYIYIIEIYLF